MTRSSDLKQELERIAPRRRRQFLKLMGAALAAPLVEPALRFACNDALGGTAYALDVEGALGTIFLEINLRDQWDHGHLFVSPSLARTTDLRRGESGRRAALFFRPEEMTAGPSNFFLTPQSTALMPHLDHIAACDTFELSRGAIHGHESANATRSPGRSYEQRPGQAAMYDNDPVTNFPQGCERFFSSTPTPASLHNYVQRQLDPTLRNGYAFKGISRSVHTAYHYAAGLAGAELDRIRSSDALYSAFPDTVQDLNLLPTAEEAELFTRVLGHVDARFLSRRVAETARLDHASNVESARDLLYSGATRVVSVPLTEEERIYWSEGVPDQACDPSAVKGQIWEQAAWAFKILEGGMTRTAALEFDYVDVHDERTAGQMETMTLQMSLTLARLIESFKNAGLWDRTLIAVYTTDGGRAPAANSSGNEGKNSVILAGGMIRGGYYGDVSVAGDDGDGHRYAYHAPDLDTGAPRPGVTDDSGRVPGATSWRTVMAALGIPDGVAASFPDVADAGPMRFMLR